jgi:hypothetical protein
MLIANPNHDNVFKYLTENLDIAKGILSTIINVEIDHLTFLAHESIMKIENIARHHHGRVLSDQSYLSSIFSNLHFTYSVSNFLKTFWSKSATPLC